MNINLAVVTFSNEDENTEVMNSSLCKSFKKFNPKKEIFHHHFNRGKNHQLESQQWEMFGKGIEHQVQSQTEFITYRIDLWREKLKNMDTDYIISCDTNDVVCLGPVDRLVDMFDLDNNIIFSHEKNTWPTHQMKSTWKNYQDYRGFDLEEKKFLNAGMILAKKDKYIELLNSVMDNVLSMELDTMGNDQGAFTYYYNSNFNPQIKLDYTNKFGLNTFNRGHNEYFLENNKLVSKKHGTTPLFIHDNGWDHGSPRYSNHFKLKDLYE
tara:strand:- start:4104 stop:4904 length:801 start_codon:yes stop_codon:yes gene_type:complete